MWAIRLAVALCAWLIVVGVNMAVAQQKSLGGESTPAREEPSPNAPTDGGRSRFVGCFKDQGNPMGTTGRDLDGMMTTSENMTNAQCVSICRAAGYRYAGTQYGKQCFCGNAYGRSGASTGCSYKCSGHPNEICGGFWANSVSRTGR